MKPAGATNLWVEEEAAGLGLGRLRLREGKKAGVGAEATPRVSYPTGAPGCLLLQGSLSLSLSLSLLLS